MASARFLVSGKVQGVWYRASTRDEALRLGLRGHAGNLADGRVEILAGLKDGDQVVAKAGDRMAKGQKVRVR